MYSYLHICNVLGLRHRRIISPPAVAGALCTSLAAPRTRTPRLPNFTRHTIHLKTYPGSQVVSKMSSLDAILAGKYPAKAHARRVAGYLQERGYGGSGVIYLEAQKTRLIEDNDEAMPFR